MSKVAFVILSLALVGAAYADQAAGVEYPYAQDPYAAANQVYAPEQPDRQYVESHRPLNNLGAPIAAVFGLLVVGVLLIGGLAVVRNFTERDGVFNKVALLERVDEAEEDLERICNYIEQNSQLTVNSAAMFLQQDDPNDAWKGEVVRLFRDLNQNALNNLCRNNKK